jgi:cyclophilin family peptidyl-prolyl cis-trans isomerase
MNIKIISSLIIFAFLACAGNQSTAGDNDKEQKVLIKTEFGDMVLKLYNETPLHRDNFIKLVQDGFYDDLLFHRVIKGFMIQGGDPQSKNAPANRQLGSGGPGYTIDAEILDGFYHKKGALAAARQGDNVNPERKSSGSQFYIVHGKVYDEQMISQIEERQKFQLVRTEALKLYRDRIPEVKRLEAEGKTDSVSLIQIEVQEAAEKMIDESLYKINKERREVYTSVGGAPHLDAAYTVFGEVIEGLHVIDSIANVQTKQGDRPVEDIKMKMELIK